MNPILIDAPENVAVASVGADSPEHQFSLRSSWNLTDSTEFDLWLRYVDDLEGQNIPSYVTMDARYMWSPIDALELGIVGRNLLEDEHAEFVEEFGASMPAEVPREVYLEMVWHF